MLIHRVAMILRIGATICFISAVAILVKPDSVATFIGLDKLTLSKELIWLFRCLALALLVIAVLAPLIASFGGERGLRQCASAMAGISFLGIVLLIVSPTAWVIGKLSVCAGLFIFCLLYLFALRGRRRNR